VHGGVKIYRGNAEAARSYVEADHGRVDDYYLAEGTGHPGRTTMSNAYRAYAHLWPTAEDRTRKTAQSIMSASLGRQEAPETTDDLSR